MNNQVRQLLSQLIRDYGNELADDPLRLEIVLTDRAGAECKREIFLCVQAAREGVATALLSNENKPFEVLAAQLVQRLHNNYALDMQAARWAVSSWIVALGLADKFSSAKTPEKPAPAVDVAPQSPDLPLIDKRYIDNGNGTVKDKRTGLYWLRYSLGQKWQDEVCLGEAHRYKWQEALAATEEFNENGGFADYSDWRLPFIDELESLIELDKKPSINHRAFPATPASLYWSASAAIETPTWHGVSISTA